jgi:ferredoxin/predicted CopG family antitoxin
MRKFESVLVSNMGEERTITIDEKAYQKLSWAKKDKETDSDVIVRLISTAVEGLQRRGEKEILTSDKRKLNVRIDQSKCMGAESCVALAPEVFALDVSRLSGEPLGMKDVMDYTVDSERIIQAARTCPYKAIYLNDAESAEEIFP